MFAIKLKQIGIFMIALAIVLALILLLFPSVITSPSLYNGSAFADMAFNVCIRGIACLSILLILAGTGTALVCIDAKNK